jgi:hypothetical protein
MSTDVTADGNARRRLSELLKMKIFEPTPTIHVNSDDGAHSDESIDGSRDFMYMREPGDPSHDFPDVTEQVIKLNHGRLILFSDLYENILLQSEFDELEQDFLESFMMDSSDSGSDSDDDDNDGDDDDEF